jgi:hypothetical protein
MTKNRIPIPEDISAELRCSNRHTCCICRISRKHTQIHHIDSDPSNNNLENLVVLCLDCHSIVTGDEGLGRRYTGLEVTTYKTSWERLCKEWLEGGPKGDMDGVKDEALDSDHFDDDIEDNSHIEYTYDLEKGEGVLLWVKSDEPIDLIIMRRKDYKKWLKEKVDIENVWEMYIENVNERHDMFIANDEDKYTIVIANFSSNTAQVQADISTWKFV